MPFYHCQTLYENGARQGQMRLLDPCRSLAFDVTHEALFAGWETGRVTVHSTSAASFLNIHASFYAHQGPVLKLVASPLGPLVLGREDLTLFTHGGVPRFKFPRPIGATGAMAQKAKSEHRSSVPSASKPKLKYTCMAVDNQFSRLYVASETDQIHLFDLETVAALGSSTARTFDAKPDAKPDGSTATSNANAFTCMCYGRRLLCCGRADGTVVLYDERTMRQIAASSGRRGLQKEAWFCGNAPRSRSFRAHANSVTSVAISGDLVVTCGDTTKVRRRHVENAAIIGRAETDPIGAPCYHSDNLSKVFDLRMMRSGMPLQYSYNTAPAQTVFFADAAAAAAGATDYRVLAASHSGSVTFHDVRQDFAMADMQQLQQQLPAEVGCVAVAPSGQLAAVGDCAGGLHLWAAQDAGHEPRTCAYGAGTPLEAPAMGPPPPSRTIPPAAPPWFRMDGGDMERAMMVEPLPTSEGAVFTVNRPPLAGYAPSQMLSAMPVALRQAVHRPRPAMSIHPNLLAATKQDPEANIGYIDMGALKLSPKRIVFESKGSGLVFGKDRQIAYGEADPRRRGSLRGGARGRGGYGSGAGGGGGEGYGGGGDDGWQRIDLGNGNIVYIDKDGKQHDRPPRPLRPVTTQQSRFGMDSFDFGKYNKTRYAGLENMQPNSFLNPLLQLLYFIPPLHYALKGYFSGTDSCLSDELGFLFHMLDRAQQTESLKSKSVEPLNFLRYFRGVPEAAALGLLEPSKLGLARRIGACTRFLLEHINKELKTTSAKTAGGHDRGGSGGGRRDRGGRSKDKKGSKQGYGGSSSHTLAGVGATIGPGGYALEFVTPSPLGGNVIEEWFGCTFANVDRFKSGSRKERDSRSFVVNLEYPSALPPAPEDLPSFVEVLRNSLTSKKRVLKAWCETSKLYEPLEKTRTPKHMPSVFCLNCMPESGTEDEKEWLRLWRVRRVRGGGASGAVNSMGDSSRAHWLAPSFVVDSHGKFDIRQIRSNGSSEDKEKAGAGGVADQEAADKSRKSGGQHSKTVGSVKTYVLSAIISHVVDPVHGPPEGHLVLHSNVYDASTGKRAWHVFNDFAVSKVEGGIDEVLDFTQDWRTPCLVVYETGSLDHARLANPPSFKIMPSVFASPSISLMQNVKPRSFQPLTPQTMLKPGDLAAIDCEFVATAPEESKFSSDGRKIITKPVQLALARVSVCRGDGTPILDDYILKTSPISDYLTRFSGLHPGDLDPSVSPHHLVSLKTAYLKLRYLVDLGVVFVGHGLSKDFRICNIAVPEEQIIDTVNLFHLPSQRLIGLRYLTRHYFDSNAGIQDASRGHDSIEDALGALRLKQKYDELKAKGELEESLKALYAEGHARAWKN